MFNAIYCENGHYVDGVDEARNGAIVDGCPRLGMGRGPTPEPRPGCAVLPDMWPPSNQ